MKYLEYISILLWTIIRKVAGVPITMMVIPFRGYARNTVYNYVLQNGVYLQRLLERPILGRVPSHFIINGKETFCYKIDTYHYTKGGYIKYRKISYIEYKLVYWLIWGWLDDDSNQDTYDKDYSQSIVDGKRMSWIGSGVRVSLLIDIGKAEIFGNSFDLGDKRAEYPLFGFWSTLFWSMRNTAYNFKYMQMEKHISDKNIFMIELGKWKFGWKQDTNNKDNFSFVAFGWD